MNRGVWRGCLVGDVCNYISCMGGDWGAVWGCVEGDLVLFMLSMHVLSMHVTLSPILMCSCTFSKSHTFLL